MDSFTVETLSLSQIRAIYRERMKRDFPPDELKPLKRIERAMARDEYVCYGAAADGDILAYAYFVKLKENGKPYALFDYYAVRQDLRGRNIGSLFIQALMQGPLHEMDCVLLEVDDPACAETPEEKDIRNRRFAFYMRNGLRDTGVIATVFGVQFKILTLPMGNPVSREEARRKYAALYRSLLPARMFAEQVFIHGDG
ncbi:MAG: GNAT family N-acetyltransferase [Clostridia bacterium]|nr:GNAT family N-acetyltransferase [Clostridia bacterium]